MASGERSAGGGMGLLKETMMRLMGLGIMKRSQEWSRHAERATMAMAVMGMRLTEGIDPGRYAALSGRALDPRRIAVLLEEGAISVDASGRLRVTQAGFPVLDAVVADLAA